MSRYLDITATYDAYKTVVNIPYFVDKTRIIEELIPRIHTTERYVCITRPRRFGKTIYMNDIEARQKIQ